MTHTDKKQELIEQLRGFAPNLYYGEIEAGRVDNFILARDASITSEVATNPPLDTEELEKQIATILSTYTAPKNVVDSHNNTYYDATFLEAKRKLLALFA